MPVLALREITNIDLFAIVKELAPRLVGKRVDKFYQFSDAEFFMKIKGDGTQTLLVLLPNLINITNFTREFKEPTAFAMTVRKYLENRTITAVEQLSFDRIVKISTNEADLIIEFFGKGNILLSDKNSKIIASLRLEETKTRRIARNEQYVQPPSKKIIPDKITAKEFFDSADKELPIIVNLSRIINFPAVYFNMLLEKESFDPKKKTKELAPKELEHIFASMNKFVRDAGKKPTIFEDGTYSCYDNGTKKSKESFDLMSELFDKLYSQQVKAATGAVSSARIEKIMKKLKHQQENLRRQGAEEKEAKETAELLLKKKETVEQLIAAFSRYKKNKDKEELQTALSRHGAKLREGSIEIELSD